MIKKNQFRLIAGGVCIFIAVAIAVADFLYDHYIHHNSPSTSDAQLNPSLAGNDELIEDDINEVDGEICDIDETLTIQRGDTLSAILQRADIDNNQSCEVIEKLRKVFDVHKLRPEHEIYITYQPVKSGRLKKDLKALYIRPALGLEISVQRDADGSFTATKIQKELKQQRRMVKGVIQNSLYIDAVKQNVPPKILHEMIQAFSYDVDFQRSFHIGDGYGIVYETYSDPESLREESGQLQFAQLKLQDKVYKIYRFKSKNGSEGFYNEKGESIKKGLLRTPIDGARISSTFGNRRHPILGYNIHHKGIDFAAPRGTPIMAAGDGVVVRAQANGNYGNYVQIRHNQEFSTAYAHLKSFAKGLRSGSPVRQGQIIGYVGMTGRTTGPHLHYELIRFNKQINPNSIKMLPTSKLDARDIANFRVFSADLAAQFDAYQQVKNDNDFDAKVEDEVETGHQDNHDSTGTQENKDIDMTPVNGHPDVKERHNDRDEPIALSEPVKN